MASVFACFLLPAGIYICMYVYDCARYCCCCFVVALSWLQPLPATIKLPSNLRQSCEAFLSHAMPCDVVRTADNCNTINNNNNESSITMLGSIDSSDVRRTPGDLGRHTIICFIYAISADSVCLPLCGFCAHIFIAVSYY